MLLKFKKFKVLKKRYLYFTYLYLSIFYLFCNLFFSLIIFDLWDIPEFWTGVTTVVIYSQCPFFVLF